MMRHNFLKTIKQVISTIILFLCTPFSQADVVSHDDCRPLELSASESSSTLAYSDALLWQVTRDNENPSYLFGTIHVSDERVTRLPEPVIDSLDNASVFVMEALPDPVEAFKFTQMMMFDDDRTLTDFLDAELFEKTKDILSQYQLPAEVVTVMKPWAVFLMMNYPAEQGVPLDLHLHNLALQNGATVTGLETLTEQGNLFSGMAMETQVQLLLDTVCNYDIVDGDFEVMKTLYLDRDLQGLHDFSMKYTLSEEKIYRDLFRDVLTTRNRRMVDRMEPLLAAGDAFIAIGALHLPGHDGVLSLLEQKGYTITSIY